MTSSPADRVEPETPQRGDDDRERGQAALEGGRRADPEGCPHPEAEIECAGMHQQPLEHVLMAMDVRPAESACLVEMRARSLEQFSASAEEPLATAAADATAICVHGISFVFLIDPRVWPEVRCADVCADLQRLQIASGAAFSKLESPDVVEIRLAGRG